jgi:HEAT repeat protein
MRLRTASALLVPLVLVLLAGSLCAHGGASPQPKPPEEPGSGTPPPAGKPAGSGSGPKRPLAPSTPGPAAPGAPSAGLGATLGGGPLTGGAFERDLSNWSLWWELNQAAYLDLKAHVSAPGAATGVEGFFLGAASAPGDLGPSAHVLRNALAPALLDVLERDSGVELVSGALVALGKVGRVGFASQDDARRFQRVATRLLAHANQEVRETAAVALGILGDARAIPALANLVWDTAAGRALVGKGEVDTRTRAFAAYALGLIGARAASAAERQVIVAALARALERTQTAQPDLPVACVLALSLVPLATPAPSGDPERAGPPEGSRRGQFEFLLALMADQERDAVLRAQCPIALARLLASLTGDDDHALRSHVTRELVGLLAQRRAPRELLQSCVLALGEIGTDGDGELDARIRAALQQAFAQAVELETRGFALIALARSGGRRGAGEPVGRAEAAEFLVHQLTEGKSTVRAWAALASGVLGHALVRADPREPRLARLRSAVRARLEDERDPARLGAAAIAAGLLGDAESGPLLEARFAKALPDEARGHVATGLALLGRREALPLLRRVLGESLYRAELLRATAIALAVLEDKSAAPELVRLLDGASSLVVQTALSTALGYAGDARVLEPLLAALVDERKSERARGYAAVALGNVADPEALPWNASLAHGLNYRATTATLTDPVLGGGILDIF